MESLGREDGSADALAKIGEPAVDALIDALTGSKRYSAAIVLGQIGNARAVEPLIALLATEKYACREAASIRPNRGRPRR